MPNRIAKISIIIFSRNKKVKKIIFRIMIIVNIKMKMQICCL